MKQIRGVAHDGDVALPKYQIAALELRIARIADSHPQCALLHIGVARARHAAGRKRNLHQARAVEPKHGLAAPEIGRAEKTFGHRDEIGFVVADRFEMNRRHIKSGLGHRHAIFDARDGKLRAERKGLDGR